MKKILLFCFFSFFIFIRTKNLFAQCPFNNTSAGSVTPTCGGTTPSSTINGGQYLAISVVNGNQYTFSTCGNTSCDTQLSLYNSTGTTSLAYNDDGCGLQSSISWTATFTGTVNLLLDQYNCANGCSSTPISITCGTAPASASGNCAGADPFCTGTTYTFPAATNTTSEAGPNYGCLFTQPNPAWYYLKIGTSGNIDIFMQSSAGVDIDFICWGPFTSATGPCTAQLTAANTVDCSYSTAASETDNIPSAVVGQYYLLLITNFSNQPTNITFSQTGGTGATDCSIVTPCPVTAGSNSPLCAGQTLNLTATTISGATYSWTGPGGYTSSSQNPTRTNVTTAMAGTYTVTVSAPGPCTSTSSVTVTINPLPTVTVSPSSITVCSGFATTLTASGANTYTWSPATGLSSTTGTTVTATPASTTTYTVTGTTTATGCTNTATTTITVNPALTISVTPSAPTICTGGNVSLTASGATTYSWSPSTGLSATTGATVTASPSSTTTYTVTGSSTNCNNASTTVTVTVNNTVISTFTYNGNQCLTGNSFNFTNTGTSGGGATYSWTFPSGTPASSTSQSPSGVTWSTPGTYTITHSITQGGCTSTTTQTITVYAMPATSATGTNPLCNGGCTGTLTGSATGGATAYSYSWSGGLGSGATKSGVCAGTYTLTVTDANGCTGTASVTLTNPTTLTATATATAALCNGVCNGTLTASGSGGVTPYSYSWSGGLGTGATKSSVCAGTYTVTITDANGCTTTQSATVNQPALLTASASATNATCNATCNGTLTASASGGTTNYTYNWSGGLGAGATKSGVCAGTYTVTVTDANGCTKTATATVSQPTALTPTATGTNVSCNGGNNGSASVSVSGGTTSYSYSWSSGSSSSTATGLSAGTYSVTVTDGNLCTAVTSVVITQPAALTATATAAAVSCNGSSNGSATANPSGGTSPYTYQWSGGTGFQTTKTATGLAAGTYTVTISDNKGCTTTASTTVNQPSAITAATSSTNSTCGSATGTATVTAAGGTSPYTFKWSTTPQQTSATATGLMAGSYTVTVTDANNCTQTATATVSSTGAPAATITSAGNVNCFGGNNGTATVSAAGGATPYTYLWSPSGGTNPTANGLTAGSYCVNVTDNNNCVASACTTITQPTVLAGTATGVVNANCNGACNGSATISVSGGTSPYSYSWQGGGTSATKTGLCAGSFNVTVTDANSCVITVAVTITQPTPVSGTITGTATSCNGSCNGGANLTPSGGTSPYTFNWDDGETVEDATLLCATSHTVIITDANGCTGTATVTINQPTALTLTSTSTNSSCGQSNGQACISASGGTTNYSYLWNTTPAQTSSCATGVASGNYSITVTDANNCTATNTVTVNNSSAGTASATVVSNATGAGLCNGQATASMTGGTTPYTYLWNTSPAQSSATATGLCAGSHCVTVTDANGCTSSACIVITEPSSLSSIAVPADINCFGDCSGSVNLTVSGGVTPYSYLWSNGPTTEDINNLCAGSYSVTVTDANNNSVTANATIVSPTAINITPSPNNINCNGACTGFITLGVTGGTEPYTFLWSNGQTTATANSLCAGNYSVTVTDVYGCTATSSSTITQPPALTVSLATGNSTCNGQCDGTVQSTVSGGTTPYTYSWNNSAASATLSGLCPGNYVLTVTDTKNCQKSDSVIITQPAAFSASIVATNITCGGLCNGQATVSIGGPGVPPLSYQWDATAGNQTTQTATALCAGTYNVTVTDSSGCTASSAVTISEPPVLTYSMETIMNDTCYGLCNGYASVDATGGVQPFSYLWNDPLAQTSKAATGLCAGNYTVTITDVNGCSITHNVTITQPPQLILNSTSLNSNCNQSNGSGCVIISGGVAPYSYLWSNGNTNPCSSALAAGTYVITVSDGNNCTQNISVVVQNISGPTATISSQTNIDCNGNCNGSATASVTGGISPLTFQWSNSQNTPTASNLCAGMYVVTVTDSAGCSSSVSANISEPAAITYNQQSINPHCFGNCNGSASVTVAGGVTPYSYSWSNGQGGSSDTALCAGNYILTITDANNCINILNYSLTNPALITTSTVTQDIFCNGMCNGKITVTASNGFSPYAYSWNDPNSQISQSANGLCAGNFTVTVTDNNGCTAVANATITEPSAITASINNSGNVACSGQCNGYAQVSVSGGVPSYTYLWSDNSISQVASNLCVGNYTVTVTDVNSCTQTASIAITQPAAFSSTVTGTNVNCGGVCNGQAALNPSGGALPYTYLWSGNTGFQNTQTATALCGGNYSVTITDANGCQVYKSIFIFEPTPLGLVVNNKSDAHCGQNDGSVFIGTTGGTPPYTYQWNDPNSQTSASATGLHSGCYLLNITDSKGCTVDSLICINDITGPTTALDTAINVNCFGAKNGVIDFNVTGGTTPYVSINWYNGAGLLLSAYSGLTIGDSLSGGSYTLVVTDAAGCVSTLSQFISEPNQIVAAVTSTTNVSCNGNCNGQATVSVAGGTPPYSYSWNTTPQQTSPTATGLCAGTYSLTILDADSCKKNMSVQITQPTQILVTSTPTNASCNASCNGSVTLTVNGGTAPYLYTWSPNVNFNPSAFSLCAGTYNTTITDANGCTATKSTIVNEPQALNASSAITGATCSGCNGSAALNVNGGTSPYGYTWGTGQSAATATNLCPGANLVTVTDVNGCVFDTAITITNQPPPQITGISFTEPTCSGLNNGSATANITGGTTLYSYKWNDPLGQVTNPANSLSAGVYTITVTDANGCTVSQSVNIPQPPVLVAIGNGADTICFGETTQIWASGSGGTAPYTITWTGNASSFSGSGPHSVNPQSKTDYCFTITDTNGCSANTCIQISVTPELIASISPGATDSICSGDSVNICASATGGSGSAYIYQWSNGIQNTTFTSSCQTVSPLISTSYSSVVSDGCSLNDTVQIAVTVNPVPLVNFATFIKSGCPPLIVSFVSTANLAGLNYQWDFDENGVYDSQDSLPTFTYNQSGTYDVTLHVSTAANCSSTVTDSNYITVYPVPIAGFTANPQETSVLNPEIAFDANNLTLGADSILLWNFGDNSASDTGFAVKHNYKDTGKYTVVLTAYNKYGCEADTSEVVIIKDDYAIFVPDAFTPNGDGKNDFFFPKGVGFNPDKFKMWIFDRWGDIIFETNNINIPWDGKAHGGDKVVQVGVYLWMIETETNDGEKKKLLGHVTVVR